MSVWWVIPTRASQLSFPPFRLRAQKSPTILSRRSSLIWVSSVSGRDPVTDYEVINRELAAYDPQLATRPQIVVATKIDALDEPDRLERLRRQAGEDQRPFFAISSVTGAGVRELIKA